MARDIQVMPPLSEIVDSDAVAIGERYEEGNSSIVDAVFKHLDCGAMLTEIKKTKGHGAWQDWLAENEGVLRFEASTARRLMKADKANKANKAKRASTHVFEVEDALKLSRKMWGNEGEPFVTANTGKIEWYTPPRLLDRARAVLGGFDLDPASSATANENVQAARYFTAEDDALLQEWPIGRIWMNPPYSSTLMKPFCQRFAAEMGRGSTGIVLVNNATETGWFNALMGRASAACFLRGRVRYLNDSGEEEGAPLQGQAAIYCGPDAAAFREQFGDSGFIVEPVT